MQVSPYLHFVAILHIEVIIMSMKRSVYNVIFHKFKDGDALIYNSFSCSFGIIDDTAQKIYNKIEYIDEHFIFDDRIMAVINMMYSKGFIVDEGVDEFAHLADNCRFTLDEA